MLPIHVSTQVTIPPSSTGIEVQAYIDLARDNIKDASTGFDRAWRFAPQRLPFFAAACAKFGQIDLARGYATLAIREHRKNHPTDYTRLFELNIDAFCNAVYLKPWAEVRQALQGGVSKGLSSAREQQQDFADGQRLASAIRLFQAAYESDKAISLDFVDLLKRFSLSAANLDTASRTILPTLMRDPSSRARKARLWLESILAENGIVPGDANQVRPPSYDESQLQYEASLLAT